jgi:hypothetical protein
MFLLDNAFNNDQVSICLLTAIVNSPIPVFIDDFISKISYFAVVNANF